MWSDDADMPAFGPARADWIATKNREARTDALLEADPLAASQVTLSRALVRELRKNCDPREEIEWGRALTLTGSLMAALYVHVKQHGEHVGADLGPMVLNIIGFAGADLLPTEMPTAPPTVVEPPAPVTEPSPVDLPTHRSPLEADAAAHALLALLHEIDDPDVCDLIATRVAQWEAEAAYLRANLPAGGQR